MLPGSMVPKTEEKTLGDVWEESWVNTEEDTYLQKRKIISSSCLGGVWGCYLGRHVVKPELERLWEIYQRSLGLIA